VSSGHRARIGAIEWSEQWPAAVDGEAWSLDPAAFEALLAALVQTSIRRGSEPGRLPYTVYDLPLAHPPRRGGPGPVA
jgi:hypothetical protein